MKVVKAASVGAAFPPHAEHENTGDGRSKHLNLVDPSKMLTNRPQ
jgi:hypothetical protein